MSRVKQIINWTEVGAWSLLIFSLSGESFTAARTLIALKFWVAFFDLPISSANLVLIHAAVRKGGHLGEFFIFGLLLYRAFSTTSGRFDFRQACWVVAAGLFLAAADELRQGWVRGRTPSLSDIAWDSAGVLASQLWIASRARWRLCRANAEANGSGVT